MAIDSALERCAVLGAAGKMGKGIALLLLQEMSRYEAYTYGATGLGRQQLILIDSNFEALIPLRKYLREQLKLYAMRHLHILRNIYSSHEQVFSDNDLVVNFVEGALDSVCCSTELATAAPAKLVFEALPEDIALKCHALQALACQTTELQHYFSNTSSIPITLLNERANLQGRIVGLHFYYPAALQQLAELVILPDGNAVTAQYAQALLSRLRKAVIIVKDFPGFLGNGYIMREIAFACQLAEQLVPVCGWPGAIYAIDYLTQNFLIRPTGIFQLIDHIGIETCVQTAMTMGTLLHDKEIVVARLAAMVARGIRGGQGAEGQLLAGFFRYRDGVPEAVYNEQTNEYIPLDDQTMQQAIKALGKLPSCHHFWKDLVGIHDKKAILKVYFEQLFSQNMLGAHISAGYLSTCRMIANALLESGVAATKADIDCMLILGFRHLYSLLATWLDIAFTQSSIVAKHASQKKL